MSYKDANLTKDDMRMYEELHANGVELINTRKRQGHTIVGQLFEEVKLASGKVQFKKIGDNHTLIGGTQVALASIFGTELPNKVHMIDESPSLNILESVDLGAPPRIFGFALSTDGGSTTTVKKINRASEGFDLKYMLPFRMIRTNIDKPIDYFKDYALRSVGTHEGIEYATYWLKKIKSKQAYNRTLDGDILPDYPGDTIGVETEVESVMELRFSVTKEELREHFALVEGDIDKRRMSALMLVMGVPVNVTVNGTVCQEWRKLIVTNRLNIKERNLGNEGELSFVYKIYSY